MTFTTTPPTTPGYFNIRNKAGAYEVLADVYLTRNKQLVAIVAGVTREFNELKDYEWCRLVPAEFLCDSCKSKHENC